MQARESQQVVDWQPAKDVACNDEKLKFRASLVCDKHLKLKRLLCDVTCKTRMLLGFFSKITKHQSMARSIVSCCKKICSPKWGHRVQTAFGLFDYIARDTINLSGTIFSGRLICVAVTANSYLVSIIWFSSLWGYVKKEVHRTKQKKSTIWNSVNEVINKTDSALYKIAI